jgi:nucleotide-binding universal stress UspA family protein
MYERILFPLDFSQQSLMMLDCLLELKRLGAKEIILLYVGAGGEQRTPQQQSTMANLKKKLQEAGMESREVIAQGDPVAEITKIAAKEKVDLVAMASSGKGKAREFFLGSTSFGVLRSSSIPVFINKFKVAEQAGSLQVRPACSSFLVRALVPVDFGTVTTVCMDLIPKLSKMGLQEVVLFHVVESSKYNLDGSSKSGQDAARFDKVTADLDKLKAELIAQGVNASTHIHFGTVSYNVLEAARELDCSLIVLGAHRKSVLHELVLGGNSEEVVRKAHVPLLVLPCSW